MLNTETPVMESSNGDTFLPVVDQTAAWAGDQVAPESLTAALPQDTECPQEDPNQQNSTKLGSVQQFQLYQEEQPPLPPQPPQPPEETALPSEPTAVAEESQQYNQEATGNNETQGKQKVL